MKTVQINITCDRGSTGKICRAISERLSRENIENYILYSQGSSDYPQGIKYEKDSEIKLGALESRLFGNYGFESRRATLRLIEHLDRIAPDLVHLHNLHGHNADLGLLLLYLKEKGIRVYWTFHDCWAFTGYCPHYTLAGCLKWQTGCERCPQKKRFSWLFDRSSVLQKRKKELLECLELTVITPSEWLAGEVKKSFLKNKTVKVIHNGIDLSIFHPVASEIRAKYSIRSRYLILGVAFDWGVRKGLDIFIELSKLLDGDYQIMLVGTNDEIDRILPDNIISIHRTADQNELAQLYSASDVFLNPTREENYPTVNMEALACGTPVVTFDVGGSPEMLDSRTGRVVEKDDIDALIAAVREICEKAAVSREDCLEKSKSFSDEEMLKEYLLLYETEKNSLSDQ